MFGTGTLLPELGCVAEDLEKRRQSLLGWLRRKDALRTGRRRDVPRENWQAATYKVQVLVNACLYKMHCGTAVIANLTRSRRRKESEKSSGLRPCRRGPTASARGWGPRHHAVVRAERQGDLAGGGAVRYTYIYTYILHIHTYTVT